MKYSYFLACNIVLLFSLSGCAVGHKDYINFKNRTIGTKVVKTKPFKWTDSGKLIRSDFLISGEGLTRISKDDNGNLIFHYSVQEILSNYHNNEWVGKCLTYDVVDPNTYIIKAWGFDEGGNPLSCRSWP